MEIKNLKKAAERILKAVKNRENIVIYGDADMDGISSVIILRDAIKNAGGQVIDIYFPDRETEGYGLTEKGLNFLKKHSPALLITVDCGIGNFREVKMAKELGFEVLIIDHHLILDKLPDAKIIVDPKQKGDKYSFKGLASTGIIFKLSELLLKDKMAASLRKNFLELTALATIADMMPKEEDNKIFIEEGLSTVEDSLRPGIRAFFENENFKTYPNLNQKISKIISILNVRDLENRLPAGFRLLTSSSFDEAASIVEDLLEKSRIRREMIDMITQEVERRISKKPEPIIFEGDASFELTLISSSASALCQRYSKPTFIYKKMAQESHGTVRTQVGVDAVALMKKCAKFLITYGGHPQAAGFRLKNENLEKFKDCLLKYI